MVQLNPDVQGVQIPEEERATKPIDQPGADKSKGMLFESLGKGLSNAGDLFKEAVKVKDYTNEQYLKNRLLIDAGSVRDERDEKEKSINQTLTGVDPDMSGKGYMKFIGDEPGISAFDSQLPKELTSGFVNKAQTMAAARANLDQQDVYYQGRMNALLKRYRNDYPEYRDFIDKVAERNGFGSGANEYFNALRKANLAIQNQLVQNSPLKEWLPVIRKGVEDGLYSMDLGMRAASGDSQAMSEVERITTKERHTEAEFKRNTQQLGEGIMGEKNMKANTDIATRNLTQTYHGMVAGELANTQPGHLGYVMQRIQQLQLSGGDKTDAIELQNLSLQAQAIQDNLRRKMTSAASTPIPFRDPSGNPIKGQDKNYTYFMGADGVNKAVTDALSTTNEILSAAGSKKFDLAQAGQQYIQGFDSNYARDLYKSPDVASAMASWKFVNNVPEAAQEFMKAYLTPDTMRKLGNTLTSVARDHGANIIAGQEGVSEALKKTEAAHSADLNNTVLNYLDIISNKKFTTEQRNNVLNGFFGDKEKGLLSRIPVNKRSDFYASMTSPDMIRSVKELGPNQWNKYFDYVTNEFRDGVFGRELADVRNFDVSSVEGLKITWHPEDHHWGIDVGKNKNIQDMSNAEAAKRGVDVYLMQRLKPLVNHINTGVSGLSNVLEQGSQDKTKVDAYLHQVLDGLDRDQVYVRGSIKDKMKSALDAAASAGKAAFKEGKKMFTGPEEDITSVPMPERPK